MSLRKVRSSIRWILAGALFASVAPLVAAQPASAGGVPSCSAADVGIESLGGPNFYIDDGASPAFTSSYTGFRVTNSTGAAMTDVWVQLSNFSGGSLGLASGQASAEQIASLSDGADDSLFWYLTASAKTATAQSFDVTVYDHDPNLPNATVICTQPSGFNQVIGTIAASANKVTGISVTGGAPALGSTFTVSVTGDTGTMGSGPSDNSDPYSLWMSPAVTANWPPSAFRLIHTNLNISPDGTAPAQDYTDTLRVANLGSKDRSYTATYTFRAIGFTSGPTTVKPVQEIASGTQVKHTGSYSVSLPTIAPPVNTVHVSLAATPVQLDLGGGQADYTGSVYGTVGTRLDSFVLTPPAGATFVSGSATFDGSSLPDPVESDGTLVFAGPFTLTNTSVPLNFSLDLPETPGDRVTSLLAGLGSALIGTDTSDLSGEHPATATVNVDTAPVAEDLTVGVPWGYAAPVNVLAHTSDADGDPLTVVEVSQGQYGTVTLVDGQVTYTSDGEYLGPDSFTYTVSDGRGGTALATVNVNVQTVADQTITFPPLDDLTVGDPGQADATSDSGLPVVYSSRTTEVCTVDPETGAITTLTTGTCTIAADQPGDEAHTAAEQVTRSFTVNAPPPSQIPQTITVTTPEPVDALSGPITLDGAADSELPVSYESETPDVCTVDAETGVVTLLAAGTCTITITQDGNEAYEAAEPVEVSFEVQAAAQTIDFHAPHWLLTGPTPYPLTATTSADLPVTFTVPNGDEVCTVDGDQLMLLRTGSCVVTASTPATGLYAAAAPVSRTVFVVKPLRDSVTLPPTTGQSASHAIDVLGNDPTGLTLVSAGSAAHGSTAVSNGHVVYTPEATFRGVDQFRYRVSDDWGRTASAQVTVRVRDAAPVAGNATLHQLAASTARVQIPATDLNLDTLTMTVVRHPAHVAVAVSGRTLTVHPAASVTGRVRITVAVHDGVGGTDRAQVVDVVRPQPVSSAWRTIDRHGTHIRWSKAAAAGARYLVRVNGQLLCTTQRLSCHAARLLGPGVSVTVTVRGHDGTRSTRNLATPRHGTKVLVGTVYFASAEWTLDATQRAYLRALAHRIAHNGFGHVQLRGYTDSIGSLAYNLHLSHQRTATVARILHRRTGLRSSRSWYGEKHPAVTGAAAARNRRVEIYVSY